VGVKIVYVYFVNVLRKKGKSNPMELPVLFSLPVTFRVMKLRMIRWSEQLARIRRRKIHVGY
jgi:hypothetical protein